ncbi:hypothetical protein N0V85_005020 [Neurospora sp. IMI 360204]|nr:hypothetical protein N0V85_005020 [Neurospora sp. IMI 360204]
MLPSTTGMFSFCQTGPADLNGSSWDATTEGPQNFSEFTVAGDYYTTGDAEDCFIPFSQNTPRPDQTETMEDYQARWNAAAVAVDKVPKAEPMRRMTSQSSTSSHKQRITKSTPPTKRVGRSRVPSVHLISTSSALSKLDVSGNGSSYQDASLTNGRIMDVPQFSTPDFESFNGHPAFYTSMMNMPDGLPFSTEMGASAMNQHVNPQIFTAGMIGSSPQSWGSPSPIGSSRMSSPGFFEGDVFSGVPSVSSPEESTSSISPVLPGQSPRYVATEVLPSSGTLSYDYGNIRMSRNGSQYVTTEDIHGNVIPAIEDAFSLPPAFGARRMSADGESARDHYLYKNALPQADGLFHCPWEGETNCNHKPEKLKCNYDKFVDSHLKPYRCKVEGCQNARFSSTACLLRHEREAHAMHGHGEKPYLCTYEGCERSLPGHGFPRQWNLRDHMRRVHNDNGSTAQAASSPPPSGASASSRGRKRKSEGDKQEAQEKTSSRKSANKISKAEAQADVHRAQWSEHQKALQSIFQEYLQPEDPQSLQYIKDAQEHLAAMGKLHQALSNGVQPRSWKM